MAYSYVLAHDLAGADTLKQLLVEADGWLESDHLPAGWLFKEFQQPGLEGGRGRVVHGYQFITRHGDHLTGHNKALAELREKEEYGQQDLDRFARLLPERQAVHRTWEQDWAEVIKTICTSVPYLLLRTPRCPPAGRRGEPPREGRSCSWRWTGRSSRTGGRHCSRC